MVVVSVSMGVSVVGVWIGLELYGSCVIGLLLEFAGAVVPSLQSAVLLSGNGRLNGVSGLRCRVKLLVVSSRRLLKTIIEGGINSPAFVRITPFDIITHQILHPNTHSC